MKSKKMNTYLKYGLLLLGFTCLGAVLGCLAAWAEDGILSLKSVVLQAVDAIRTYILAEMLILFVVEVIVGEYTVKKMKRYATIIDDAEDEEFDQIDYEIEKTMALGNSILTGVAILAMVILATTYSMNCLQLLNSKQEVLMLLAAFILFILLYVYNGYWGVRAIKLEQKRDPAKKGDPASLKFTEQWVESCDEAEKELIYQSAYKTYLVLSKWIPLLMVAAMLMHLLWNTGIAAIVFIGIIWLVLSLTYQKNAVQKKGQKLGR